jgi:hypothetical protein
MTYNTFTEPAYGSDKGELHIIHKSGSVSWKLYADNGGQHLKVHRDGKTGAHLWLSEFYTQDSGKKQEKMTAMHLELEQLDQLINHLQAIKAEITK